MIVPSMFARRPAYLRTAAVVASAVGLTAIGLNKAAVPRGLQQFYKTTGRNILIRGMATASMVKLDAELQPEYYVKGSREESAKVTSELLQENHEKHHIFFNNDGFHDHIVHHLLTLFALNATPAEIKRGYNDNLSYQRHLTPLNQEAVDEMHDPEKFTTYLGKAKYYHEFLQYFRDEINKKGWESVINDELLQGSDRTDDLLARLFGGFLHPIIHLGFGVEFRQPAIIAEALAQAAIHNNYMKPFFLDAEKAANENKNAGTKTVVSLLTAIRADDKLSSAAHWSDGNKIRDGILARAPKEMLHFASQYRISSPTKLAEKTAEMLNAAVYFTACAQRPAFIPKFDFFYMHSVNCSIFFSAFLNLPSLSDASKVRLLEWKVRNDLAMYASRGSPELLLEEVKSYEGKNGKLQSWDEVILRVNRFADDGHASKLLRTLAHGEAICKDFEGREGFEVKGDMWVRLGNMVVDSVEAGGPTWVRSCGFDEAWEGVPKRVGGKAKV